MAAKTSSQAVSGCVKSPIIGQAVMERQTVAIKQGTTTWFVHLTDLISIDSEQQWLRN